LANAWIDRPQLNSNYEPFNRNNFIIRHRGWNDRDAKYNKCTALLLLLLLILLLCCCCCCCCYIKNIE
jgi:hypothetical protein